jgi:hypothetical protein
VHRGVPGFVQWMEPQDPAIDDDDRALALAPIRGNVNFHTPAWKAVQQSLRACATLGPDRHRLVNSRALIVGCRADNPEDFHACPRDTGEPPPLLRYKAQSVLLLATVLRGNHPAPASVTDRTAAFRGAVRPISAAVRLNRQ